MDKIQNQELDVTVQLNLNYCFLKGGVGVKVAIITDQHFRCTK